MLNDSALQESVRAALNWEPSINAAHIGVTANAGVVTLTGHVDSFAQKHAAEEATAQVRGVRGIAEEIEVQLPFDKVRTDDEIAAAAVDRLNWDVCIPPESIKVQVEKGWVTLSGEVEWYYVKESAEQNIRQLFGVIGVSNQIRIRPNIDVSDITDKIAHAMHRAWFFDPEAIAVSAVGGRVILAGTVHSLHEWNIAALIAWSAPGTTAVQNDIMIV